MYMKIIFTILLFFIVSIPSSYATTTSKTLQPIAIDIDLKQTINNKNTSISQNKIILTHLNEWTAISNLQSINTITKSTKSSPSSSASNQSLALIKISEADNNHLTLQFLILNQEASQYSIVEPRMTTKYGQKSEIHINDNNNEIVLIVIAKKSHNT